jgi:hypothetical protein
MAANLRLDQQFQVKKKPLPAHPLALSAFEINVIH